MAIWFLRMMISVFHHLLFSVFHCLLISALTVLLISVPDAIGELRIVFGEHRPGKLYPVIDGAGLHAVIHPAVAKFPLAGQQRAMKLAQLLVPLGERTIAHQVHRPARVLHHALLDALTPGQDVEQLLVFVFMGAYVGHNSTLLVGRYFGGDRWGVLPNVIAAGTGQPVIFGVGAALVSALFADYKAHIAPDNRATGTAAAGVIHVCLLGLEKNYFSFLSILHPLLC
jgi:hypothetical protein